MTPHNLDPVLDLGVPRPLPVPLEQEKLHLTPGMQVAAEIKLADQTVMQYLLSPVTKAFHEAGRER